jgi:hypothetical protein
MTTTTTTADAPVVAPAPRCLVVTLRAEGGGSWYWMRWIDGQWVDDLLPGQTHASAWVHESDLPRDTDRVLYVLQPAGWGPQDVRTARTMADHRDAVRAWTGRTPAVDVMHDRPTGAMRRHNDPARWHPASNPKRLVRWPRAGWR